MNWWALLWMVILLVANGFFVAAEFASITARRNVLEQRGTRPARAAVRLTRELSSSLAAAQLGITMASLLLGYVAEPAVAGILERGLGFLHIPENVLHAVALTIALAIVVFLHMVIGEMAPKNIAIAAPERSALAVSLPFRGFILVFRPVIALLNGTANGVLRLLRVKPADVLEAGHSAQDLAMLIAEGRREGVIGDFAHRLLTGAIVFGDRDALEVMVPRPDTVAVDAGATVGEIEEVVLRSGHSRIPIHTGDLDDVLGFVHVKDLLGVDDDARGRPLDPSLIRPLLVVAETVPVRSLLTRMRRTRNHMALVVDEHGGTSGIITLEDVAEELVGDIWDEYDRQPTLVRTLADGSLVAAGSVHPERLAALGVELPAGKYETLGGFVMHRLRRVPRTGDFVEEGGWRIRVSRMEGRRVREVRIGRAPAPGREGPTAAD
jgi:CBS domain containing-hemolysin-like protein